MKIIHTLLLFLMLAAPVVSAAYEFVVHDGRVYEVKSSERIASDEIGVAIGEVTEETSEMTSGASNAFPVGTFFYEIRGVDRSEAIAVETSPGEYVQATYTESSENGLTIWTILLGIVGILVVVVGTMSFRNQRSHVKQYRDE